MKKKKLYTFRVKQGFKKKKKKKKQIVKQGSHSEFDGSIQTKNNISRVQNLTKIQVT